MSTTFEHKAVRDALRRRSLTKSREAFRRAQSESATKPAPVSPKRPHGRGSSTVAPRVPSNEEAQDCLYDVMYASWYDACEEWYKEAQDAHSQQRWTPVTPKPYTAQQARVDDELQELGLVRCALSFTKSVQAHALPGALPRAKLLRMLRSNFGSTRLSLPSQCAADVAVCLLWQCTRPYAHATEQLLGTLARNHRNHIVATPFLGKAKAFFSKNASHHLPNARSVGAQDQRKRFVTHTVVGVLRLNVCPEALLDLLLQLELVARPYNDVYPLSENRTPSTPTGNRHKHTLATDTSIIDKAMHTLETRRDRLYRRVFYTSWKNARGAEGS